MQARAEQPVRAALRRTEAEYAEKMTQEHSRTAGPALPERPSGSGLPMARIPAFGVPKRRTGVRKTSGGWFGRVSRIFVLLSLLGPGSVGTVLAQKIAGRYVSKAQEDGTIYHTFPETLFENPDAGDFTFDITYKSGRDGRATINFTYFSETAVSADSVRFEAGRTVMAGPVTRIYAEPEKKRWKHRCSFCTGVEPLQLFFDEEATPGISVYAGGREMRFRVKRSAWRSYAPVGYRIFEMIRANEPR